MGVSSLPKTVTRQRRDFDLNPGPSAPESSTLTTRPPSHPCHRECLVVEDAFDNSDGRRRVGLRCLTCDGGEVCLISYVCSALLFSFHLLPPCSEDKPRTSHSLVVKLALSQAMFAISFMRRHRPTAPSAFRCTTKVLFIYKLRS